LVIEPHEFLAAQIPSKYQLSFQVLGKDELMPEDEREANLKWKQYMLSYVSSGPTEGVDPKYMRKAYLKRYAQKVALMVELADLLALCACRHVPASTLSMDEQKKGIRAATGMEMRICLRTFRHFFNPGTDWFARIVRKRGNYDSVKAKERLEAWLLQKLLKVDSPITEKAPVSAGPEVNQTAPAPAPAAAEPQDIIMSTS
jgi:histone deacetylase complex regulatory component SIN3